MFFNTKDTIQRILGAACGLPEESGWIDYKSSYKFTPESKEKIGYEVVAFLNCLQEFGQSKFILFGIRENKKEKTKELTGLGSIPFPDDNEWQNVFHHIKPRHPTVETGVVEYQGRKFGYFHISANNYHGPYYYPKDGTDKYCIRRGSSKFEMMPDEKDEFQRKAEEVTQKGMIFPKTKESMILSVIGQYHEGNCNDRTLIEEEVGETFETFKQRCLWQDPSLIQHEKSMYVNSPIPASFVDKKHERLLQFSSDDVVSAMKIVRRVLEHREIWYSEELLDGVMDTLTFLSSNGFSYFVREVLRSTVTMELVRDSRYRSRIAYIAESAPDLLLALLQNNKVAFADCKRTFIQALQTIAWFPEHYIEAVRLLWELGETKSLYRLLCPEARATAASFQQKLQIIREITGQDQEISFDILYQVLYYSPKTPLVFETGHIPQKYIQLSKWPQHVEIAKLQIYYSELLELVGDNTERVLKLLPRWLTPFPYSNLNWLADLIEQMEPKLKDPGDREKLWNRLCNLPLEYASEQPIEDELKRKLTAIGQRFRPNDPYAAYRQWFLENSCWTLHMENTDPRVMYKQVVEKQNCALLELYRQGGINLVIAFLTTVPDRFVRSLQLLASPDSPLTEDDDKALLSAFIDAPKKYADYFYSKSHTRGSKWLGILGVETLNPTQRAEFFAALEPSAENLQFFENHMGKDVGLYWAAVQPMALTDCLQTAFEELMKYGLSEKAFELFQYSYQLDKLPPQWLFQRLMSLREYSKVRMPGDVFARAYQTLSCRLDDAALEDLEILSFERYGDTLFSYGAQDLRPQVTFWRIANDPEFFLECVKNTNGPLSFEENLLNQCDATPDRLQAWLERIDALCTFEAEDVQKKAEDWVGYILYNELKTDESGSYTLDTFTSGTLEQSERKREGFFRHAYYSFRGFHTNGEFEDDAKDRESAGRFRALAEFQKADGNVTFAERLIAYADQLIKGVESV
ncbi:ATP-binding protein [Intestinimonas butyriciproducens]|uniref:ATP-binding protein n=1 Tax=Intestinimonas butyriciproducens TaxID=1297617 RepID=UPI0034E47BA2